jgi:protein-S-isoprenylcysteine O-methyltransferase Ste14
MLEKIILIILTILYLVMFITRNLIVKKRTGQSVRKADILVRSAIISTTLCFVVTFLSTSDRFYNYMGILSFLKSPILVYIGLMMFLIGIILGWTFSSQLKDSWRFGIFEDQKTALITDGVYAHVRNPCFVSYFIIFLGLLLIRPSIVVLVLVISSFIIFHKIVLKEEAYLYKTHGIRYEKYREKTGRYFPRFRGERGQGSTPVEKDRV